jgi:hypothetical protein
MQLKVGLRILVLTQPNNQFMAFHILSLLVAAAAGVQTVVAAALVVFCLGCLFLEAAQHIPPQWGLVVRGPQ